jgi:hypothetical protein
VTSKNHRTSGFVEQRPHTLGIVDVRFSFATRELHRDMGNSGSVEKRNHTAPSRRCTADAMDENHRCCGHTDPPDARPRDTSGPRILPAPARLWH